MTIKITAKCLTVKFSEITIVKISTILTIGSFSVNNALQLN